jgi:hypothetical protein
VQFGQKRSSLKALEKEVVVINEVSTIKIKLDTLCQENRKDALRIPGKVFPYIQLRAQLQLKLMTDLGIIYMILVEQSCRMKELWGDEDFHNKDNGKVIIP